MVDRKTLSVSALLALSIVTPARAEGGSAGIVVEYAEKAISRGYGSLCSLAMIPVKAGGYYPCIDFGPYRYVRGYESVGAYVVQEGKEPFRVMSGTAQFPMFTVDGPWSRDMPLKIVSFWNDVVDGAAARTERAREQVGRKRAAEEYINSLVAKDAPPPPKAVQTDAGEKDDGPDAGIAAQSQIGKPVEPNDLKKALEEVRR